MKYPTKTEIHLRAQENYSRELHFRPWSQLTVGKWLPYLRQARSQLLVEGRPQPDPADPAEPTKAQLDVRAQENYLAAGAPHGPWEELDPEAQFACRFVARAELRAEAFAHIQETDR